MPPSVVEGTLVALLFLGYTLLWRLKQRQHAAETGKDPEVIYQDPRPSQRYFAQASRFMTITLLVLIILHAAGIQEVPGFYRIPFLNTREGDLLGCLLGVLGLLLCWRAQRTMGTAWRVGIDQHDATPLVTTGVFAYVRNPTYSGLSLICAGAWVILPSFSMLTWCLIFGVMLEFQVRSEEEFLLQQHGDLYATYCAKTKRYIPFVY